MTTRAWLAWSALSLLTAVIAVTAIVSAFAPAYLEAGLVVWAAGMAWSAGTPTVLRWVGRRVR